MQRNWGYVVAAVVALEPPPVALTVHGGGLEPVTIVCRLTVQPHADNRGVCIGYTGGDVGSDRRSCWGLDGDKAPKTTQLTFSNIRGEGEYWLTAELCRGHWEATSNECSQRWIVAAPQRFMVVGMGNLRYRRGRR